MAEKETLRAEDLAAFLELLRASGSDFHASDQQYIAAYELMAVLAAGDQWPKSDEWRTLLAPVICSSLWQQQDFYDRFRNRFGKTSGKVVKPPDAVQPKPRLVLYGAAGVLVLLAALIWYWPRPQPVPVPDHVNSSRPVDTSTPLREQKITLDVLDDTEKPINGAAVYYLGRQAPAISKTELFGDGSRFFVLATHEGFVPVIKSVGAFDKTLVMVMVPVPTLPNGELSQFFLDHFIALRWAGTLFPAVALLAFVRYLFVRRLQVRRLTTALQLQMQQVGIDKRGSSLFSESEVRKLALNLRRRQPRQAFDLDPERTATATAGQAGLFTPVAASMREVPDYLVLGERKNQRDHQSCYFDELFNCLDQHDVYVHRYYFFRDPRVCVDVRGKIFELDNLAAIHGSDLLWLRCDGTKMVDPGTGEPELWVNTLSRWPQRTLLASVLPRSDMEMYFGDPSFDGIAELTGQTVSRHERIYPTLLRHNPDRWCERDAPPEVDVERLLEQVHFYLGPSGYLCLSTCALYPDLNWLITRKLADELIPALEREQSIAALSRLPWLRYGLMPDWLRYRLVGGLTQERNALVRRALQNILTPHGMDTESSEALEVAPSSTGPDQGQLNDHVLLSFLWGRKVNPLAVEAPRGWRRLLRDSIVLRVAVCTLMAASLSLAVWLGTVSLRQRFLDQARRNRPVAIQPENALAARALDAAKAAEASWRDILPLPQSTPNDFVRKCFEIAANVLASANPLPEELSKILGSSTYNVVHSEMPAVGLIGFDTDFNPWLVESVNADKLLVVVRGTGISRPRSEFHAFLRVGPVEILAKALDRPIDGTTATTPPPDKPTEVTAQKRVANGTNPGTEVPPKAVEDVSHTDTPATVVDPGLVVNQPPRPEVTPNIQAQTIVGVPPKEVPPPPPPQLSTANPAQAPTEAIVVATSMLEFRLTSYDNEGVTLNGTGFGPEPGSVLIEYEPVEDKIRRIVVVPRSLISDWSNSSIRFQWPEELRKIATTVTNFQGMYHGTEPKFIVETRDGRRGEYSAFNEPVLPARK